VYATEATQEGSSSLFTRKLRGDFGAMCGEEQSWLVTIRYGSGTCCYRERIMKKIRHIVPVGLT
jgi:hypothetical protein